jgi:hypothetical protein
MHDLKLFVLISWLSLPTVMFGGYSFLTILHDRLTPEQQTFFRAGHAHAGVLLILSLGYYYYLSLTSLPVSAKQTACGILAVGIILQSGGFFWHAFLDDGGKRAAGIRITVCGAVLLATAVIILVYGLLAAF